MTSNSAEDRGILEPIWSLSLPSPAKSLCFVDSATGVDTGRSTLHDNQHDGNDEDDSDHAGENDDGDSDSDDEELVFESSKLLSTLRSNATAGVVANDRLSTSSNITPSDQGYRLQNRFVATCHESGEALIWDCQRRSMVVTLSPSRGGPSLAVRRWGAPASTSLTTTPSNILFQTRDPDGVVSIHAPSNGIWREVQRYETQSRSFCAAAPSAVDPNLLALPHRIDKNACVVDLRDPQPVAVLLASPDGDQLGMVTSLSLTSGPILACGMESGTVVFHDLRSMTSKTASPTKALFSLTKDPLLSVDLAPSKLGPIDSTSIWAAVGMAGDRVEVGEMDAPDQGRVGLLQVHLPTPTSTIPKSTPSTPQTDNGTNQATVTSNNKSAATAKDDWKIQLQARMATCKVGTPDSFGKPGVSICRFRPGDARLLAVGSWDHRVRIFDRAAVSVAGQHQRGRLMGVLKGHVGNAHALDWAPDAPTSGLLATAGSEDHRLYFWKVYGDD